MTSALQRPLVRRGFLRWSIVAFAILLPALGWSVWDYVEARRFKNTVDAIVAHGEPIRNDPYRRFSPQAHEAERMYRAAATLAEGLFADLSKDPGFPHTLSEAERTNEWAPDVEARVRALADRYHESVVLAERAAALPFDGFATGSRNGYLNSGLVSLARVLGLTEIVAAFDGDAAAASRALSIEARFGPVMDNLLFSPIRFVGDVRVVVERMRLSGAGLAPLADAVDKLDIDDRPAREMRRQRAVVINDWQLTRQSYAPSGYRLYPPWSTREINRELDVFSRLIPAAETPWPERIDRTIAVGVLPTFYRARDPKSEIEAFMNRYAQDTALTRAARIVVAIERYRRDHREMPPAKLDDLVPAYLPSPPIDPFTGRAMLMHLESSGYVVYSVGVNRRDEGGADVNNALASATAWPRGTFTNDTGIRIQQR